MQAFCYRSGKPMLSPGKPYTPPTPYPDPASLPVTAALEASYPAIRAEAAQLLEVRFWPSWTPYAQAEAFDGDWDVFSLYGGGQKNAKILDLCPVTAAVLATVPHLRQALFSSLSPGTRINPHRGTPGIVRVHLPLMAEAGKTGWRVDGVERDCIEGRVVVFEDGSMHEGWNLGQSHRITLLFDSPAPYLSDAETARVMGLYDRQMEAGRVDVRARHAVDGRRGE